MDKKYLAKFLLLLFVGICCFGEAMPMKKKPFARNMRKLSSSKEKRNSEDFSDQSNKEKREIEKDSDDGVDDIVTADNLDCKAFSSLPHDSLTDIFRIGSEIPGFSNPG